MREPSTPFGSDSATDRRFAHEIAEETLKPTWLLLIVPVVLVSLNLSDFCYRDMRFHSDDEIVRSAIEKALSVNYAQEIKYKDSNDVMVRNPDCCKIIRHKNPFASLPPFVEGLFGRTWHEVSIKYRSGLGVSDGCFQKITYVNSCGDVAESFC